jgi:hypothetical protein
MSRGAGQRIAPPEVGAYQLKASIVAPLRHQRAAAAVLLVLSRIMAWAGSAGTDRVAGTVRTI